MRLIREQEVSNELLSDVIARQCVLWLVSDVLADIDIEPLLKLVAAPWRGIFVECSSGEFASAIESCGDNLGSSDTSGAFTHLIASDPLALQLQRRATPVFFLNGRKDRGGLESATLPRRSAERRRLNMTARLRDMEPRRVIVVGDQTGVALEELASLWDAEFRSLLTIATTDASFGDRVEADFGEIEALRVVQWVALPPADFALQLVAKLNELSTSAGSATLMRLPGGSQVQVDLSKAELVEQPIADFCDFIGVRDMLPVSPDDLEEPELQAFFTQASTSWRPYSAGLPWVPNPRPAGELLKALEEQLSDPPGSVQVLSIISEAGAGGTTQARMMAFAAARAGFPTLLVRQEAPRPSALELTGFMFRAVQEATRQAARDGLADGGEPVWVIVLDVQHLQGSSEELQRFCAELARSGRKVAILNVALATAPIELPQSISHRELLEVSHALSASEVSTLGAHLNVFLRRHGRQKSAQEWLAFWQEHQPDFDVGIASFWVALEFWLAGFLPLGESIQAWALRQFKALDGGAETQRALLEICAFSIERRGTPERLLALLTAPKLPWSMALGQARETSPGIGLVSGEAHPYGRVWAIVHDILARYLVAGVWNDRLLCESLGIAACEDPVALRLELMGEMAKRSSMGEPFARPFAINLATSVLKLDEQSGNAEFFKYWHKVLAILESVPQAVRLNSRTFNHHVAISRRRVTQGDFFELSKQEKQRLLGQAVKELEFALDKIEPSQDDEPTLNLLNTLALVYQDLADLERDSGDPAELARLLAKSDSITARALNDNPNNSYVLETAAKNQLRQGMTTNDPSEKVESAARALTFVFQASRLDSINNRKMKLGSLAAQALKVLREEDASDVIESLCRSGSPYGFIAKAWSGLPVQSSAEATLALDAISPGAARGAIAILMESPERNWLLVRLLYDLVVIAEPTDFQTQLRLLDELDATKGYQLSLQQVLERAVLLFIAGQNKHAEEEFKWLRPRVKESQVVVSVPQRLRWLPSPDRSGRAICSARVVDSAAGVRAMARVRELGNTGSPFNPQEFGKARMAPNEQFKCQVTFAAMGPFLKPVDQSHR